MNDYTDATYPTVDGTHDRTAPATPITHPAGDIQLRRPATSGLRVALLLGMSALASANTAAWTTVSVPGAGA